MTKQFPLSSRSARRIAAAACIASSLLPAAAAAQGRANTGNAVEIAKSGSWEVFSTGEGRSLRCLVRAAPTERLPRGLNRDPAYFYVSMPRGGDANRGEVAMIVGFPMRADSEATVQVGSATFAMLPRDRSAWLRNPAEEARLIAEMRKGTTFTVKSMSMRGNETTDRYSLTGFVAALERAQRACREAN